MILRIDSVFKVHELMGISMKLLVEGRRLTPTTTLRSIIVILSPSLWISDLIFYVHHLSFFIYHEQQKMSRQNVLIR